MSIRRITGSLAFLLLLLSSAARAEAPDATALIRAAIEYWRDVSSYAVFEMHIHRPDWQRSMTMRVWTRGNKESLVRVTAPAKDAGNGTLLLDNDMWSYNPKINRVIKIPSSMMNQSWMPNETAPVVWGREVVKIRDDHILMEHAFYDQSNVLIKKLATTEVKMMGGKMIAARERMQRIDKPDEWTDIVTHEARFGIRLPANTFTLANLRNPRN
jgi:hypothetical protein